MHFQNLKNIKISLHVNFKLLRELLYENLTRKSNSSFYCRPICIKSNVFEAPGQLFSQLRYCYIQCYFLCLRQFAILKILFNNFWWHFSITNKVCNKSKPNFTALLKQILNQKLEINATLRKQYPLKLV